jgi:hypothetical protein
MQSATGSYAIGAWSLEIAVGGDARIAWIVPSRRIESLEGPASADDVCTSSDSALSLPTSAHPYTRPLNQRALLHMLQVANFPTLPKRAGTRNPALTTPPSHAIKPPISNLPLTVRDRASATPTHATAMCLSPTVEIIRQWQMGPEGTCIGSIPPRKLAVKVLPSSVLLYAEVFLDKGPVFRSRPSHKGCGSLKILEWDGRAC